MSTHPRLAGLVAQARERAHGTPPDLGIVYPCDALALDAAARIADAGIARPVLVGPRALIEEAAAKAGIDSSSFEIVATTQDAREAAAASCALVRSGRLAALMKGSLHTDELMSAVVDKTSGLRGPTRISHAFVFDLPRYPKLLAAADCVVNISPHLATKRDIVSNAVSLLRQIGIQRPKIGVVAAVETVNPAMQATIDAAALAKLGQDGAWPDAIVEGPLGFDNAISADAARIKGIESRVAGDADLLVMPDLNAGNMLYKSFVYVGGGECAGLVLGATVPIVLTSRADSLEARIASVALASLAARHTDRSMHH